MEYETHESKQITQLCGHDELDGTGDEHGDPGWRGGGWYTGTCKQLGPPHAIFYFLHITQTQPTDCICTDSTTTTKKLKFAPRKFL